MTPATFVTIRDNLGLTRAALAGALGVSTRAVQSWEIGARDVPEIVARIMRLAAKDCRIVERLERSASGDLC